MIKEWIFFAATLAAVLAVCGGILYLIIWGLNRAMEL